MSDEDKKPWWQDIKDRFEKLQLDVAYMRGELDEMKRHNQRTIKILAAVITGLMAVIGWLIKEWPGH